MHIKRTYLKYAIENNSEIKITDDVVYITGNDLNSFFLIKNYNESKSTFDIYFKNGSKTEKVAFDVKNMYIKGLNY